MCLAKAYVRLTCYSDPAVCHHNFQLRHKQSWEVVNAYVQRCLKVWTIKPEQTLLPTVLPWIEQCFEELTYVRSCQEEGVVVWINLTTAGILSAMKKNFLISLVTGFLTTTAGNSIAVIVHANRATDTKSGSEPHAICFVCGMCLSFDNGVHCTWWLAKSD